MAHYSVICHACKAPEYLPYLQYPERCKNCGSMFIDVYFNEVKVNLADIPARKELKKDESLFKGKQR